MAILKLKNKTTGEWEEIQAIKGNGISSIEKTSTSGLVDTYTIYFTNGSTTTYEVSNGEVTREELQEEVDRLSMIYNAFPSTTGEGEEPSINGTAEVPFKEIGLKGNTSQEGTPTPDSPQDIHTVSGDNTINICGKNLLKLTNETKTDRGITGIISNDNVLTYSGTATGPYSNCTTEIPFILPSGTYTFSIDHATTNNERIVLFLSGGTSQTIVIMGGKTSNTFTSNGTNTTMRVDITNIISGTSYSGTVKMQLEKGSTATTYEPHIGNSYPISLGNIELCKIGDYQDRIYKDNGKWYKYGAIGKVNINIFEWSSYTSDNLTIFRALFKDIKSYNQRVVLCNYFKALSEPNIQNGEIHNKYGNFYNLECVDTSKTLEQFRAWLSQVDVFLYYILSTPTTTEITDTTLIEQLDNLEKAYSYDTQTNISQTNQDKPFIISYEAILSLKNVLNNLETRIAVLETE